MIISKSAQLATDNYQYKSAIRRIMSDTPVSINTPEVVDNLAALYPDRHNINTSYTPLSTKN